MKTYVLGCVEGPETIWLRIEFGGRVPKVTKSLTRTVTGPYKQISYLEAVLLLGAAFAEIALEISRHLKAIDSEHDRGVAERFLIQRGVASGPLRDAKN